MTRMTLDDVDGYVSSRRNLSYWIVRTGNTKRVRVRNDFWVEPERWAGPAYSLAWSDYEMLGDCASSIAEALRLKKVYTVEEY